MSNDIKFKIGDRVVSSGSGNNNSIKGQRGTVIGFSDISNRLLIEFDKRINGGHDGYRCFSRGRKGMDGHCWYIDQDKLTLVATDKVTIYREGNQTIAEDNLSGRRGIAKCCPDDDYVFGIGAKLALERLFEQQKPKIEFAPGMAIWCNTKEEVVKCKKELKKRGYKWSTGSDLEDFCFYYVRFFVHNNGLNTITYSEDKDYISGDKYKYIDFKDVIWGESQELNTKIFITKGDDNFETGKIYEVKDGTIDGKYPYSFKLKNMDDLKEYFAKKKKWKEIEWFRHYSSDGIGFMVVKE